MVEILGIPSPCFTFIGLKVTLRLERRAWIQLITVRAFKKNTCEKEILLVMGKFDLIIKTYPSRKGFELIGHVFFTWAMRYVLKIIEMA